MTAKHALSCDLAGESAILNLQNGVYYGVNPVGTRIWTLARKPTTFADLRNTLLTEYDVQAARLESDLRAVLDQLFEQGLIEIMP